MDQLDVRLLGLLQKNNLLTADQLGDRVGRSSSAVARRLRRLRSNGAVAADASCISEAAAGHPLFAVIQVQLERHAAQAIDILRRRLVDSANVQLCLEISGSFDILLMVAAADMDSYNRFAELMLANDPAVRRFETTFVKKRAKATLALPLEELLAQHGA